jgi:hypothetical protein
MVYVYNLIISKLINYHDSCLNFLIKKMETAFCIAILSTVVEHNLRQLAGVMRLEARARLFSKLEDQQQFICMLTSFEESCNTNRKAFLFV